MTGGYPVAAPINKKKGVLIMGIGIVEDTESMWLEADLIERGAFLEDDLLSAYYETIPEIEPSEVGWSENEWDDAEDFSVKNNLLFEMVDIFESAGQRMFVCVGGNNYLVKREDGVYGISA